jgi:hypothetical protein
VFKETGTFSVPYFFAIRAGGHLRLGWLLRLFRFYRFFSCLWYATVFVTMTNPTTIKALPRKKGPDLPGRWAVERAALFVPTVSKGREPTTA